MNDTETPQDSRPDPQPAGQGQGTRATAPGIDTRNLRDYTQLRRSRSDRKIAGVAGGLGRHLNIDPTVIRVLLVVLCFFGGAGFLLYAAGWLLVPEDGAENGVISTTPSTRTALLVVAAVLAGLLLVGDSWGSIGFPWPLALVSLVVAAVLVTRDKPAAAAASSSGSGSGTPDPDPDQATAPGTGEPGYAAAPGTADVPAGWAVPPAEPPVWNAPPATYAPAPKPRADRGPKLFGFTLAFVAVALGVLGLVEAAGAPVLDAAYPALALAVVGLMLVVGSVVGRPGGLILLGIVAAVALAATTAAADYDLDRGGELSAAPTSTAGLDDGYSLLAGRIDLDLSRISDVENLDGRRVSVEAEAGEIQVLVPPDVDVQVFAEIGVGGDIDVEGVGDDGRNPRVVHTIDGGEDVPTLRLDADLTVGTITVSQVQEAFTS